MAPIILGNPAGVGNVNNIIVPYKDQYRLTGRGAGVAIGNTADTRVFSSGTVILAGTNLTISTSALGAHQYLNLSIADPAAAANYVVAGDNILLSTAGVATTISVTGLQPAGAYITTAALSNHNHGGTAFRTGNIGGTIGSYTTASATGTYYGWSLSIPDFLVTAALSNHSHTNYVGFGTTTNTTSGTDIRLTLTNAGVSLRVPRYITTAAEVTHTHGIPTGYNITIASSSNNLVLSVGNYITTAALSNHSHSEYLTTAAPGNNLTLAGNTAGTLTGLSSGTVTIAGGNNITLSQDGNAFTIIGAASGTDAGIAMAVSGSNTLGTLALISSGTLNIQGGNNITLSQDGNTVHIVGGAGNVGTGFSSASITGSNIVGTLATDGLSLLVPSYMLAAASTNFAGTGSSIVGGTMTYNTAGLTLSIPSLSATASNAVYAGNNISLSTEGVNTTVSVVGLQATSNMSLYQLTSNSSLFQQISNSTLSLGTQAGASFLNTAFSSLLQHTSDNSLSLGVNQSSLFQLTSVNSQSLGTIYTSHTHSNLYIALSESSLYRTSVLSNTFLTTGYTSHTHSNLYIPLSESTAYQTSVLRNTFLTTGYTSHTHPYAGTNTAITGGTLSVNTSGISLNIPQRTMYFSDANGVLFGGSVSGLSTTITASVTGGGGTFTLGTNSLYFADANGVTFGGSTNGSSTTITASVNITEALSTGTVYFANSLNTNVTWTSTYSSNSTYIGASAGGGTGGAAALSISAGTLSATRDLLVFSNSNNISFGLNGSTITASVPAGTVYFGDGNNITFGSSVDGSNTTIIATVNATAAGDGYNRLAAGTQTAASAGYVMFNNSNGLTFGMYGSSAITGSYSQSTHDHPFLGTTYTTHTHSGVGGGVISISAGTLTGTRDSLVFSNSNSVSFGMSGSTITASIPIGTVHFSDTNGVTWSSSTSAGNTTVYVGSLAGGGGAGGTSIVPGSYLSSSLSGSTLSLSVTGLQATSATSLITANAVNTSLLAALQYTSVNSLSLGTAYTTHTHTYIGTGISTSGNITVTANTAGLSITAPTIGYLYFSNANGHSWSSAVGGVSTSIYIVT